MHRALENVVSNTAILLQPSLSIPQKTSSDKGRKSQNEEESIFNEREQPEK
jgi:hypothetical protein